MPPDFKTSGIKLVGMRIQRFFLAGLLALLPVSVTVYVLIWIYNLSDRILGSILESFQLTIPPGFAPWLPVIGLIFTLLLVVLVGVLAGNYLGRVLLGVVDRTMKSIPLVRDVYKAVQQIAQTLLGQPEVQFSRAALIEYPRKGLYTLCFVASPSVANRLPPLPDGYSVVLVPTSPVPASGMAIIVPTSDIIPLSIPIEDALRFVVSGGFILPDGRSLAVTEELQTTAKDGD
jgi:uncharacterized membrane protein